MSWSALFGDRSQLELELPKAGTRITDISLDVCDVPELRAIYGDNMNQTLSEDARLRLALEWFGDLAHLQPPRSERTGWLSYGYTREFGQLHRLDDEALTPSGYELVNGPLADGLEPDPYSEPEPIDESVFDDVMQRLKSEQGLRSIARETVLTTRQVSKIEAYRLHPNRLGPLKDGEPSPGYALYRQPLRPGTISLRKLRPMRA